MRSSGSERVGARLARVLVAAVAIISIPTILAIPAQADEEEADETLRFVAKATLGSHLYRITSPFDTSNVSDFFNQWRYIRNQGGRPPYFVDLFHAELGLQRADETFLARVERWSFNALNERGLFEINWKGLEVDGDWRRYRGDYLRLFPEGTGGDALGFAANFAPDVAPGELFDSNHRFWIRRQSVGGEISLRPEEQGFEIPVLREIDFFGRYGTREGYLQESVCLPSCAPLLGALEGFQGHRREIDETITTVGGGLVFEPLALLTGALNLRFQSFREDAPIQAADWPGPEIALNFVPDTDRFSGRMDFSRRFGAASLQGGATVNHLVQVGRQAPSQVNEDLSDNERTSYSLWTSFDWPVDRQWDITGFAKWFHLHNQLDRRWKESLFASQDSPYIRELGELDANVELGFRPRSGTRAAVGYRADYSHRKLRYGRASFGSSLALVRPNSLHHVFYLSGRTRWRGLSLAGEIGFDWAPETAYPNELSETLFFEGRGTYTIPLSVPVTIAITGSILDGKAPGFDLASSNERTKEYERLAWKYDLTVAATPVGELSLFASYAQQQDNQDFNHVRIQFPRSWSTFLPTNDLYIDSDQRYRSTIYSLTVGGSYPVTKRIDVSAAVGLTWTRGRFEDDSFTAASLNDSDRLRNRIIGFETDIDYEVFEAVTLGAGYRLQNFDDSIETGFLDYSETVHTFTVRVGVDFSALLD